MTKEIKERRKTEEEEKNNFCKVFTSVKFFQLFSVCFPCLTMYSKNDSKRKEAAEKLKEELKKELERKEAEKKEKEKKK